MCFYGLFKNDVLMNLFIPLRRAEPITWENFISAKRDPGSTNEGTRLAGMKLFTCKRNRISSRSTGIMYSPPYIY